MRRGSNQVFRDASEGIIVRVTSIDRREAVMRSLDIATAVAEAGGPVLTPLSTSVLHLGDDQIATLWPMGDEPHHFDGYRFGTLLRQLHDTLPPSTLNRWNVVPKVTKRLDMAEGAERLRGYTEFLREELLQIEEPTATSPSAWQTLIHGDAHPGNVVIVDGQARLIDLDEVAIGPREADFAPMSTAIRRFGRAPDELAEARRAYGRMLDEELLSACQRLRQLTMASWLLSIISVRPEAEEELRHRIRTWKSEGRWNPL